MLKSVTRRKSNGRPTLKPHAELTRKRGTPPTIYERMQSLEDHPLRAKVLATFQGDELRDFVASLEEHLRRPRHEARRHEREARG